METKIYYTLPFVCFRCRKSFKKGAPDFKPFFLTDDEIGMARFSCLQCKKNLHFVGRYFKAPRFYDIKQWRKVELLFNQGWRADGRHLSPQKLRDARTYSANKLLRERTAQTESKQDAQNEKWRKMRKWPRVHLDEQSSTR